MIVNDFSGYRLIGFCKNFINCPFDIDSEYPLCDNAYEYAIRIKSVLEKTWEENPTIAKISKNNNRKYIQYRQLNQKTRLEIAMNMVIPKEFQHVYWNAMWKRYIEYDSNFNPHIRYIFDGFPGREDLMAWVVIQIKGISADVDILYRKWKIHPTTTRNSKFVVSKRFKGIVKPAKYIKSSSTKNEGECVSESSVSTQFVKDQIDMINVLSYRDDI